jgi:hypothetical protein
MMQLIVMAVKIVGVIITPLDLYLEEKRGMGMDDFVEHIYFKTDNELKDLLFNKIEEQECKLTTISYPKCTKKSRLDKELFESVFLNEIVCINIKNVIVGANYRDILKKYGITTEESEPLELPWGEWVNGTNVLIFHKDNYYLRIYNIDKKGQKHYVYANNIEIDNNAIKRLDEFLPIEKESIINNVKLSNIKKIEFVDKIFERFE